MTPDSSPPDTPFENRPSRVAKRYAGRFSLALTLSIAAPLMLGCSSERPSEPSRQPPPTVEGDAGAPNLLVFYGTKAFRHDSIPEALTALAQIAKERGFSLTSTDDPTLFNDATLASYDLVVFLLTTGDVLNDDQQAAMEQFIRQGHGFVGVHSASDTEYDWPWYGKLVGAYFQGHDLVQTADVRVESTQHPATAHLPATWTRADEWYGFSSNPRSQVNVLLSLDEASFDPGEGRMGSDHPIAWFQEYDGGRSFYTALGHTKQSYSEPAFLDHLAGGIDWALDHN